MFFLLSTVNVHHVLKVQCSVTMLPISQSLMLSHSQLDILKKTVTQVKSQTLLFFLRRTRFSKSSSLIDVRLLFMARPAQLKRRSAAALAGRGVFSWMKKSHRGTYTQSRLDDFYCECRQQVMTATGEIDGVPGDYDLHCCATHDAPGLRHGRLKVVAPTCNETTSPKK